MKILAYPILRRASMVIVLAACAMMLLGADDSPDARYSKLGHRMMCQCGCSQVLIECNHVGCSYSTRMLGELREGIAKGEPDKVILAGFVEKYGNTVLAAPTTSGFNLTAWIVPFVIFGLGTAAVIAVVRTWKRRTVFNPIEPTDSTPEQLDSYRARARQETEL